MAVASDDDLTFSKEWWSGWIGTTSAVEFKLRLEEQVKCYHGNAIRSTEKCDDVRLPRFAASRIRLGRFSDCIRYGKRECRE